MCMMCMMSESLMRSESLIMSRDLKVLTKKNAAKLKRFILMLMIKVIPDGICDDEILHIILILFISTAQ